MVNDITCPNCNFSGKAPKEKIPQGVRWTTCPRCKKPFEIGCSGEESTVCDSGNRGRPILGSEDIPSPWERRMDIGLCKGILNTLSYALFSPAAFYRSMRKIDGIGEPLAFGMLMGSAGAMMGLFWKFLFILRGASSLSGFIPAEVPLNIVFFIMVILSPFFIVAKMFITGGLIHLFLMIFGSNKRGFQGTFRVIAFSQSAGIFSLIPGIGDVTGFVWNIIVVITGLRNIHDSAWFKVIMAVIFHYILKLFIIIPFYISIAWLLGLLRTAF